MDKTSKHVKLAPIFLRRAPQRELKDDVEFSQHSPNQPRESSWQSCESADSGELSSTLQACLRDIQTSNSTFPANQVFDVLLKKAKKATEPKGENKRKQEEGESPQRVSKRLKCNKTTEESNSESKLVSTVKTRTSRLSRSRRLKQQRSLVDVRENDSVRTNESDGCSINEESATANSPEDVPWTEKYSPLCSSEVIGNNAAVTKLYSWLKKWKQRAEKEEQEQGENSSDIWDSGDFQGEAGSEGLREKPLHNAMLITGPSGVGKTAAVYACALELGFKVFEVNGSSQRSGRHVLAQLKEATQSHLVETSESDLKPAYFSSYSNKNCALKNDDLTGKSASTKNTISSVKLGPPLKFSRSSRKGNPRAREVTLTNYFKTKAKADQLFFGRFLLNERQDEANVGATKEETDLKEKRKKATSLILFEEVDVVFEDDVGFYAAIKTFMSTTKRPVVLTSNDPNFRERFSCSLEEILFNSASTAHICSYLQLVCLAEKVKLELDDAISLVTLTRGDVRRCLLQLQLWAKGLNVNQPSSLDSQIHPHEASCTASMLGLGLATKNHLSEILKRWNESDTNEILRLLAESWRRDVPLLYSNLDVLLPTKNCSQPQTKATSEVKLRKRLSRRRPTETEPRLSCRSRSTSQSLDFIKRTGDASPDCLSALTDFFELMSGLDAAVPAVSLSCRSEEFAWTGCEIRDGSLDELDEEPIGNHHQTTILEIKAAVEGLGFRRASAVWSKARTYRPEQEGREWKRKNLSFSFQPQRSISETHRRHKICKAVLSGETFGLMGGRSRLAAFLPFLRFVCRLSRSQKPDERESCLNYLSSLGLPKSIIPLLAEDFR